MPTFGEVLASRSGLSGVTVREHLDQMFSVPSILSPDDVTLLTASVVAAIGCPTSADIADAVWSKVLP